MPGSLEIALTASLQILFIWGAMQEGMILFPLRRAIDTLLEKVSIVWLMIGLILRKPLYDCLFCMSSVWGIIFTAKYFSLSWNYLTLLFCIGGINYLIQMLITWAETKADGKNLLIDEKISGE